MEIITCIWLKEPGDILLLLLCALPTATKQWCEFLFFSMTRLLLLCWKQELFLVCSRQCDWPHKQAQTTTTTLRDIRAPNFGAHSQQRIIQTVLLNQNHRLTKIHLARERRIRPCSQRKVENIDSSGFDKVPKEKNKFEKSGDRCAIEGGN